MRPGDTRPATCERSTYTGRNSKGTPSASTIPEAESPAILQVAVETPPNCGRVALHFAGTCRTGAACDPGPGSGTGLGISSGLNRGTIWSAIASEYTTEAISTAPSLTSCS